MTEPTRGLVRLQKVLAQAGLASRRRAEEWISEGRVKVDGRVVTEQGLQVDPRRQRVEVDGRRLVAEPRAYVVLHKPRGVMCTLRDPEGRPTVAEQVRGAGARLVPVGRLDFQTSGVLLMTNDGDFASALAHPRKGAPKVYVAKLRGILEEDDIAKLRARITIDGRETEPAQVRFLRVEGDKTWVEVTLKEGRNRQVRRLAEAAGFPVLRLARVQYAGIDAEGLRPGQWRALTREELVALKKQFGVPRSVKQTTVAEPATKGSRSKTAPRGPRSTKASAKRQRPPAKDSRSGASPRGPRSRG